MTFRHPYRLLAVLLGTIMVWVTVTTVMLQAGVSIPLALLGGWLSLFPASAAFLAVGMSYEEAVLRRRK